MNIELKPVERQPIAKETILLNGADIGEVEWIADPGEYRTMIRLPMGAGLVSTSTFGRGATKELAIAKALENGSEDCKIIFARIYELAEALGVAI